MESEENRRIKMGSFIAVAIIIVIVVNLLFFLFLGTDIKEEIIEEEVIELPKTHEVVIGTFNFTPKEIVISRGDSISWMNNNDLTYDVIVSVGNKEINSGRINPRGKYVQTFNESGFIEYISVGKEFKGKIIVE